MFQKTACAKFLNASQILQFRAAGQFLQTFQYCFWRSTFLFSNSPCKSCKLLYTEEIATFSAVNQLNVERILKGEPEQEGCTSRGLLQRCVSGNVTKEKAPLHPNLNSMQKNLVTVLKLTFVPRFNRNRKAVQGKPQNQTKCNDTFYCSHFIQPIAIKQRSTPDEYH